MVVFVLPQNSAVLDNFKTFSQMPQFEDKTFIIVLNNYSSAVGPSPKLIKKHRLPEKQVYRLNRNPQIQEYMNDGKALDIVFRLLERDAMVADVHKNLSNFEIRRLYLQKTKFGSLEMLPVIPIATIPLLQGFLGGTIPATSTIYNGPYG